MFFQSFEKMSILVYYQAYRDYIAKYLCENRYEVNSNCNGRCFLMKKLRKTEESNATPVAPDNKKSEFIESLADIELMKPVGPDVSLLPEDRSFHESEYLFDIFHPPKS